MAEQSSREKLFSILDKVGEVPLLGLLYESREENINKVLGGGIGFSTEKGGVEEGWMYKTEGVRELWKMAGKPKIKVGTQQPKFLPRDLGYLMREYSGGRQSLYSRWKAKFGKDVIEAREGMYTQEDIIEELSHAIQWEKPKEWSPHSSRKELFKHKMEESPRREAGEKIYEDLSTDEGYTHSVVAPKLYDVMKEKGYGFKF